MRQWMVDPRIMCRKHLLGEHLEHHMFIGSIKNGKKIKGYIDNNLLEPLSLFNRHEQLVQEMLRRGYSHNSQLNESFVTSLINTIYPLERFHIIDRIRSFNDLLGRCKECRERNELVNNNIY